MLCIYYEERWSSAVEEGANIAKKLIPEAITMMSVWPVFDMYRVVVLVHEVFPRLFTIESIIG